MESRVALPQSRAIRAHKPRKGRQKVATGAIREPVESRGALPQSRAIRAHKPRKGRQKVATGVSRREPVESR
ncbi:MAG: hypothetical protein KDB14_04790, partial [Planctomycetales bacterium]|nr:hypothetical protein [Planctomycetales bacterium]